MQYPYVKPPTSLFYFQKQKYCFAAALTSEYVPFALEELALAGSFT